MHGTTNPKSAEILYSESFSLLLRSFLPFLLSSFFEPFFLYSFLPSVVTHVVWSLCWQSNINLLHWRKIYWLLR